MIHQKTVFIIGAGAGIDFEMPLGSGLAEMIHDSLTRTPRDGHGGVALKDDMLEQAIARTPHNTAVLKKSAADKIRNGVLLARSIDELLETYTKSREVVHVGKLAIVTSILKSEKRSNLFVNPDNIYNTIKFFGVKGSWLSLLFQLMTSGVDETTPKKAFENVAFINFNYDRCLEHFFLHAVAARFSISLVDAAKVSGDAFVIHPYGYLGDINPFSSQNRSYFGQTEYVDFAAVASRIRTYTEQHSEEDATVKDIHDAISQADTLVFLGFAFHEQNLKLLAPSQGIKAKQIFATSKGMSENDINLTKSWMQSLSKNVTPLVQVEPESCADFVRKYQKSIAK